MNEKKNVLDFGLFFYGIKVELKIGDLFELLYLFNYQDKKFNYIYFIGILNVVKWGVELVRFNLKERIYIVELLGDFENDLNLIDKKFFGNLICFYRFKFFLKIVVELGLWERYFDEEINYMFIFLKKLSEEGKNVIYD